MVFKEKRKSLWRNLAIFFAVLGPGLITGSVDNDAGGITTYSVAGALYGYRLIWTLIPSFIFLIVVQEMNARMGIVTGKGLADLIRENSGLKVTFYVFIGLLIADIGNTTTEFAGIAGSMDVLGVSKYISVPIAGSLVWLLVVKGSYKIAERVFIIFSISLLMYIVSALLGEPHWHEIGQSIVKPGLEFNSKYIAMVIGMVGTTIAPWMLFYLQSSVIEKGLKKEDYKFAILDIIIGCIATVVVAFFIIIACASTLHEQHIVIEKAEDAAFALAPLAGALASHVFAFGLFVASIFSATILPLAASFYVCEAFGFEAGIDKKWKEAPEFYVLYTGMLIVAMIIVLIPDAPLIRITIWSQVLNGLFLPVVIVAIMLLTNNKKVMGEYVNKPINNIIGWGAAVIIVLLSLSLLVMSFIN